MVENLGILLETNRLPSSKRNLTFAQGPKALLFPHFTRVYYSCRRDSKDAKFISEPHFVDFSPDFGEILAFSETQVVEDASLGSFDEHGIFPLDVVRCGDELLGFSGGWSRRSSVSIDMSIGKLISQNDGLTFERTGEGPALTHSVAEPFLVGDPSVLMVNGLLHMFYISGTRWARSPEGVPERTYLISHRVSLDGSSWVPVPGGKPVPIPPLSRWEAQAMPSLVRVENWWVMFFCYRDTFGFRENPEKMYRLGVAYSENLVDWTRVEFDLTSWRKEWDSKMMAYPNAHLRGEHLYLLYNGNGFGRQGFGGARFETAELVSLFD